MRYRGCPFAIWSVVMLKGQVPFYGDKENSNGYPNVYQLIEMLRDLSCNCFGMIAFGGC